MIFAPMNFLWESTGLLANWWVCLQFLPVISDMTLLRKRSVGQKYKILHLFIEQERLFFQIVLSSSVLDFGLHSATE